MSSFPNFLGRAVLRAGNRFLTMSDLAITQASTVVENGVPITRDQFELEMIRRERRLIPALRDFVKYVLHRGPQNPQYRDAAVEGLLWTLLSPSGAVATMSVGLVALATAGFSGWAA